MDRKEIKHLGKEVLRRDWGELLLALVLAMAAGSLAGVLVIGIGGILISGPVEYGVICLYLKSIEKEPVDQRMLLEGFKQKFGDSFLAGILLKIAQFIPVLFAMLCAVVLAPLLLLGPVGKVLVPIIGVVLWICGIILWFVVYYGLCMSLYILVREPEKTAVEALKKSWAMTKGQKLRLLMFDLSFILWILLLIPTIGVILIYLAPYYKSSKMILFNDIYENSDVTDDFDFQEEFAGLKNIVKEQVPEKNPLHRKKTSDEAAPGEDESQPIEDTAPKNMGTAEPISETARETEVSSSAVTPAGKRFCPHCGGEISQAAAFCGKCGNKL